MEIDKDMQELLGLADIEPEKSISQETVSQEPVISETVLAPQDAEGKPVSEKELSPEQREIRMLRDQLAKKQARDLDTMLDEEIVAETDDTILIHFLGDRVTALGRQWYRGQEIEFDVDGQAYKDTQDRYGFSWLSLSEMDQIERWGDVQFRRGPWPGKKYEDSEAEAAERKRRRSAPTLPRHAVAGDSSPRKYGN